MGWAFNPFTGKFDYFRTIVPATDVEVEELDTATYDDVQDYINFFGDRTILSGGTITATSPADGTVAIAACTAWCKESNSDTAVGKFFDYAGTTGVTLTDLTANIIYLDYNGGTPQVVVATAPATHGFKQDHILIGAVYRYGNETHIVQSDLLGIQGINRNHMHLVEHAGPHRSSGMVTSSTGTRNLAITAGVLYLGLTRRSSSSFNTSGTDTFSYWYYDGDAGPAVWVEVTGATQISRTQYNNVATGLANLGSNRYGIHWVYLDIHGEHLHVVYGQGNYTAPEVEIASVPSSLPGIATTFSVLIAKIICQEGTDVLTITYPWTTVFKSSLATDHGSLAGLTDDDHAQYIKDSEFTAADEIIVGTGSGTFSQVTLAASQFLAKKAAGAATNVTAAEARAILNVADGADVTGDNAPQAHDLGGASHNADTWANLKGKISDITNVTAAELEYVNGVTAAIQGQIDAKLANIVEDTTPQLGGNLDCNTKKIINIVSLGIFGWSNVQISSGVLNAISIFLALEPETGTSDDLDTLTHLTGVDIVFIRPKDLGDSITVKHETDNINLKGGADITLGDEDECLCLIYDNVNSNWLDVGGAAGVAAHAILDGAVHTDSVADAVTRGSLIYGNATPKWDELVKGAAGTTLISDGTDISWSAARASITTATQTVYVDGDASGAADGTSWTDAFTTIQAAWDSLPYIIAHAITIRCREATNPYRENVAVDSKYIIASVTIEGEHYVYGDCEANVGGAGEITDTGAFGDVAVGDKVYVLDLNGANGRAQNYEVGTVDDIANEPNRIGTDLTVTPTTNWKYTIVRTEISGSDDGTDGGTARDECFNIASIDNINIYGFYMTFSDEWAVEANNSRNINVYTCILKDVDRGIYATYISAVTVYYSYISAAAYGLGCGGCSKMVAYYNAVGGVYGYAVSYVANANCYYSVLDPTTTAANVNYLAMLYINRCTITNNANTGVYARGNSYVRLSTTTNNATVPVDPVGTSEGAYIQP